MLRDQRVTVPENYQTVEKRSLGRYLSSTHLFPTQQKVDSQMSEDTMNLYESYLQAEKKHEEDKNKKRRQDIAAVEMVNDHSKKTTFQNRIFGKLPSKNDQTKTKEFISLAISTDSYPQERLDFRRMKSGGDIEKRKSVGAGFFMDFGKRPRRGKEEVNESEGGVIGVGKGGLDRNKSINWRLLEVNKNYFNKKYNEWIMFSEKQTDKKLHETSKKIRSFEGKEKNLLKDPNFIQLDLHLKAAARTDNSVGVTGYKLKRGFRLSSLENQEEKLKPQVGGGSIDNKKMRTTGIPELMFSPKQNLRFTDFVQMRKDYEKNILEKAKFTRMRVLKQKKDKFPKADMDQVDLKGSQARYNLIRMMREEEMLDKVKIQHKKIKVQKRFANYLFDDLKSQVSSYWKGGDLEERG